MNHNNHKNNIECTSKIIKENEKNKISSTDFILGDVFMEKYGQDCIDAENNNSILYSVISQVNPTNSTNKKAN